MASAPVPSPQTAGAPQGQAGQGDDGQARAMEFVKVAQMIQSLAQKYPESTEDMAAAIQALQKAMARTAGNPQRTPERQAPPLA